MEDNLSEIFTACWGKLLYGSMITSNAYHNGVCGTHLNGQVSLRTVVLRGVDPDEKRLLFYTDIRSAKIKDLNTGSAISWLFWDGSDNVQLRVSGSAKIHHLDHLAKEHWNKVGDHGKKSYMAMPGPSTGVPEPVDGLEYLSNGPDKHDAGYSNFAVIVTQVNFLEWLSLKKEGHRRAEFKLVDGSWKGQWLIP